MASASTRCVERCLDPPSPACFLEPHDLEAAATSGDSLVAPSPVGGTCPPLLGVAARLVEARAHRVRAPRVTEDGETLPAHHGAGDGRHHRSRAATRRAPHLGEESILHVALAEPVFGHHRDFDLERSRSFAPSIRAPRSVRPATYRAAVSTESWPVQALMESFTDTVLRALQPFLSALRVVTSAHTGGAWAPDIPTQRRARCPSSRRRGACVAGGPGMHRWRRSPRSSLLVCRCYRTFASRLGIAPPRALARLRWVRPATRRGWCEGCAAITPTTAAAGPDARRQRSPTHPTPPGAPSPEPASDGVHAAVLAVLAGIVAPRFLRRACVGDRATAIVAATARRIRSAAKLQQRGREASRSNRRSTALGECSTRG